MPTVYQKLGRLQYEQKHHDLMNHADVWGPGRFAAVRHYALHFGKYGRRLRMNDARYPLEKTLVDSLLVSLSAANQTYQSLGEVRAFAPHPDNDHDAFVRYVRLAGLYCATMLHCPDYRRKHLQSLNWGLVGWVLQEGQRKGIDVLALVPQQRAVIRARQAANQALASSVAPDPETGTLGFDDVPEIPLR